MIHFAYCPRCSWPALDTFRGPFASRLGRTSRKTKQDWFLISPCCRAVAKLLPTAPRTEAMLATDAAKWRDDRWTGDADPLGTKRPAIVAREAKEQSILEDAKP